MVFANHRGVRRDWHASTQTVAGLALWLTCLAYGLGPHLLCVCATADG